jgi:hypothetical protein
MVKGNDLSVSPMVTLAGKYPIAMHVSVELERFIGQFWAREQDRRELAALV